MRVQDIKINTYYRHRNAPDYGWAKAIEIIPGKTGVNTNTYKIVKCEWTVGKGDLMGFIRYFHPVDLIKT